MEQFMKFVEKIASFKMRWAENRLSSRCFRGHILHPRVTVLCMLSALFYFSLREKKYILFERKRTFISLSRLLEGTFLRCVSARTHLRVLLKRKLCAVLIRNAILRTHLNSGNQAEKRSHLITQ